MEKKILQVIKKTVDCVNSGAPLTDKEIEVTIDNLTPVLEVLDTLGPRFYLASKEINHYLSTLRYFRDARKGM